MSAAKKPPRKRTPKADPAKEAKRAANRAKRDAIAKEEDQARAITAIPTPEVLDADRRRYSRSDADAILSLIADGRSMRQACDTVGVRRATFLTWALDDIDGLSSRYARAREIGIHAMVDEITDIVDDASNDWMEHETEAGRIVTQVNQEHIARSKLRVDHRKWIAAKVLPALYGERVSVEHSGTVQHESRVSERTKRLQLVRDRRDQTVGASSDDVLERAH
jgi:hypothetical protein